LITETKVQLSSLWINYQKAGPTDAPVILLLHGLGTRASFWQPVIPPLISQGFQVIAPDLPGFGFSDPFRALYTPAHVGRLIREFAEALDLVSVIVIGHSMGGTIAGGFAIADPARIKALVFVDAYGFSNNFMPLSPGILPNLAIPSLYYRLTWQLEKLIEPIIESNFHVPERISPEILNMALAENWLGNPTVRVKILFGLGVSIGSQFQRRAYVQHLRERFNQYRFPISVIWGQEDSFIPVRDAYQFEAEIPEIALQVIPDCGHVPPLEKTDEFNQLLMQFIESLP
jgi:pimeloyl-ACP methyl ester carboxylesterase